MEAVFQYEAEAPPPSSRAALSPSTATIDKAEKLPIYAEHRVAHAWPLDPALRTLEVLRLENGPWSIVATHHDDACPLASRRPA
jgi:hypothetical protein